MNRRALVGLLLVICSLIIFIYQLKYSESAKIKENLNDFSKVESFFSSEVDRIDIKKIDRKGNASSFTIVNEEEVNNFQKLGNVFIVDKNGDLISSFVLFKEHEKYLVYMRYIYDYRLIDIGVLSNSKLL
ncbi:hypothetical protein [Tepidanaerobacter acetatoxydans]|uniref:hypothetical protein n=1 Tax=Tepidanaerobacter acetatoxydans TaxID=499229 RepID=UPI001BD25C9F|nr:hypothetical protein [Tepidanaerobacter acetatoxydans]